MDSWTFKTDDIAPADRLGAWQQAMERLKLPVSSVAEPDKISGRVTCLVSPLGIELARVSGTPQEVAGRYTAQQPGIWLSQLVSGQATLTDVDRTIDLKPDDLLFGPTGVPARLNFTTDFTQLFVKVPDVALSARLVAPLSMPLGHLSGQSGINHVFARMLSALATSLDELSSSQLRPIELSLTEFLLTCLTSHGTSPLIGCEANARQTNLHSICQTIETMLGDPELEPAKVAKAHGTSLRYLQNLFAESGKTFSNYVRTRRLERCRADLISPVYINMSVTEICFRWGFNGSAHFSRTFKSQYGIPPRDFRRQALREASE